MRWLYTIFIYSYSVLIFVVSFFNPKAKKWWDGRKNVFEQLRIFKAACKKPIVWMHCASLGEFEQGRPVIEQIRQEYPHYAILLTFFSPSGYEIRKNFDQVDHVCYLPSDTLRNARRFVQLVNPELAIFVKYEYWFNYISRLHKSAIPLYVVSAIFRPNQHFFKSYGGWFLRHLRMVDHFFTQNQSSTELLHAAGIQQATQYGDTRFDRVLKISENARSFEIIDAFCGGHVGKKTWVIGSSWPADEELVEVLLKELLNVRFIIAPHEIHSAHLDQIKRLFAPYGVVCYSSTTPEEAAQAPVLVVDTMGMLSQIYKYADIAYIGGGFGAGIHNILEAAAYKIPVVFGPKYQKFDEAVSLISIGGAFSVSSKAELIDIGLKLMNTPSFYDEVSAISKKFVDANRGATENIINHIPFKSA